MVMEIAKLTNHFEITQNLAGDYEVPNYDLIRDTLQAYADNIDEVLVVTSDELSVDGAKRTKKELKDMKDAIELSFATFMKQIDNVTKARLELKRIFTKAEGNIDTKIKEAYEEWKKEALLEYGRIASFDVTVDMLDPKVFQRKQTKKSIFDAVENEVIRLEAEYAKEEENRQTLIKYCQKANQPYEAFIPLLANRELNEVLKAVDRAEEEQKEREKREAERKEQQERMERERQEQEKQSTEEDATVDIIEPVQTEPVLEEKAVIKEFVRELWTIRLWLNDSEKAALKLFLRENQIKVHSAE